MIRVIFRTPVELQFLFLCRPFEGLRLGAFWMCCVVEPGTRPIPHMPQRTVLKGSLHPRTSHDTPLSLLSFNRRVPNLHNGLDDAPASAAHARGHELPATRPCHWHCG